MIEARCPWCGEKILSYKKAGGLFNRDTYHCYGCGNLYRRHLFNAVGITVFIGGALILRIAPNDIANIGVFWGAVLVATLSSYKSVCKRYDKDNDTVEGKLNAIIKPKDVEAAIDWSSLKDEGLILPRLRVIKGLILPICIVDENDRPLSNMWCIEVTEINPLKKQYDLRMRFLLDEAPQQLLSTNCRFFIYNNNKVIGKGKVMTS